MNVSDLVRASRQSFRLKVELSYSLHQLCTKGSDRWNSNTMGDVESAISPHKKIHEMGRIENLSDEKE